MDKAEQDQVTTSETSATCGSKSVVERRVMRLPPMDEEIRWILGRPNFTCAGIAAWLREAGHEIKFRSEDEQAAVIYWMMNLYLEHGAEWRNEAKRIMASDA